MIARGIIPCLDVKDGYVVKGVNFVGLKNVGDPVELAKRYDQEGADELIFLDISKTVDGHALMLEAIKKVADAISIPLTVGGGIKSLDDISRLLEAGASKISINSAAIKYPSFVTDASKKFGSERIVVAIDTKYEDTLDNYYVYTHGGMKRNNIKAIDWVKECEKLGAGELLITSMDHDGVQQGFDYEFLSAAAELVNIPITASGGAGKINHFVELFEKTSVANGLAASIFHDGTVNIGELKSALQNKQIEVRL